MLSKQTWRKLSATLATALLSFQLLRIISNPGAQVANGAGGGGSDDEKDRFTISNHDSIQIAKETNKQIQKSHGTSMNRYPDEYLAVKLYLDHNLDSTPKRKILSFGSSTGEEAITLASLYFNSEKHDDYRIYAVDIDEPTLTIARKNAEKYNIPESKIYFFNGMETNIDFYGEYDVIFANSVLCFHGSGNAGFASMYEAITTRFPFNDFESTLLTLDASLKEGGLLAIVNSNYEFGDSNVSKRYEAVAQCEGNFVPKVDAEKKVLVDLDMKVKRDCVWVKTTSI